MNLDGPGSDLVEEIFDFRVLMNRCHYYPGEQNAHMAFSVPTRLVMETGNLSVRRYVERTEENPHVRESYMGGD
jgi:ABC-type branched-subunit amino acid transport system ATPase component